MTEKTWPESPLEGMSIACFVTTDAWRYYFCLHFRIMARAITEANCCMRGGNGAEGIWKGGSPRSGAESALGRRSLRHDWTDIIRNQAHFR